MGPLVNEGQRETVEKYVEIGKKAARLVCGGNPLTEGPFKKGWYFEPTIFADVAPDARIAQEEIFGPVLSVLETSDLDDAIGILNNSRYGLSNSIYAKDVNGAFRAIRDIEAGITYVNGPTIGAEVQLPFGGVKRIRATVTSRPRIRFSTPSASGNRSTSITAGGFRKPRSIRPSEKPRARKSARAEHRRGTWSEAPGMALGGKRRTCIC
jgi:hypothetical protein